MRAMARMDWPAAKAAEIFSPRSGVNLQAAWRFFCVSFVIAILSSFTSFRLLQSTDRRLLGRSAGPSGPRMTIPCDLYLADTQDPRRQKAKRQETRFILKSPSNGDYRDDVSQSGADIFLGFGLCWKELASAIGLICLISRIGR